MDPNQDIRRWKPYSLRTVDIVRCHRCERETRYPGREGYQWRRRVYSASRTEALCQKCFKRLRQS